MADKGKKGKAVEPEPEAAAEVEPAAEPIRVDLCISDLTPGETFSLDGERYRLKQMYGDTAQVVQLKTVKRQVAPKKYVPHEIGIATLNMPGDTVIE
jgi:hypothetical protein